MGENMQIAKLKSLKTTQSNAIFELFRFLAFAHSLSSNNPEKSNHSHNAIINTIYR